MATVSTQVLPTNPGAWTILPSDDQWNHQKPYNSPKLVLPKPDNNIQPDTINYNHEPRDIPPVVNRNNTTTFAFWSAIIPKTEHTETLPPRAHQFMNTFSTDSLSKSRNQSRRDFSSIYK